MMSSTRSAPVRDEHGERTPALTRIRSASFQLPTRPDGGVSGIRAIRPWRGSSLGVRGPWRPKSRDHGAMRITTDDGVGLAVEVAGHGPGLVLVHGFGGAKEDFADHVPALAARSHGRDLRPPRSRRERQARPIRAAYSLDRLRADTLAGRRRRRARHFRLLGHSMGGMVARKLAHRRAGARRRADDDGHVRRARSRASIRR